MADNIKPEVPYRTAIAERGKFWQVEDAYLSSLGYPSSGEGKYAILTYQVNTVPLTLSGDVTLDLDSENLVGAPATFTVMQAGAIAETNTPATVSDGDTVAQWFDEYGRQVIAGFNQTEDAIDVYQINDALLNRLGPYTNLSAVSLTGSGPSLDVSNYHNFTIHLVVSSYTAGGSVSVEHSLNGTDWVTISPIFTVSTNGVTEVAINNQAYKYLRTNVLTYNDGTTTEKYTTYIYAGN